MATKSEALTKSEVLRRWRLLRPYLDRWERSLWAAAEAEVVGKGGRAMLTEVTGICNNVLSARIQKLRLTKDASLGSLANSAPRVRNRGRKRAEVKDPGIEPALERILRDETAGDPMTNQRWVRSSLRRLSNQLGEQGHKICYQTVRRLLRRMGYSLQANKKRQAGATHPDRDAQFLYIASQKAQFLAEELPVISIDTKKKELIGNYRREGRGWRREPIEVDTHFVSGAKCVAVPFGIYDLARNAGYVTVGISHNTSEFAVNCLVSWWESNGRSAYPRADRLLILADGGGGNGYNLRSWKKDLQDRMCDAFGLKVTVSHYPPGCSKWNPVEYRLFSQISMNWAGRPLRNIDTMLAFIRGTTTSNGLKVEAGLDKGTYRKGRKVTERQLNELALVLHEVCPRWNYTLKPRLETAEMERDYGRFLADLRSG
jgi:Rhodopirellula transposase DDE domain